LSPRGGTCPLPLWKCCTVFCALEVTAKRSVDELFKRYFHNLSSTFGASPPGPYRGHSWTPLVTFVPRPLICPPLEKILRCPWSHTTTAIFVTRVSAELIRILLAVRFVDYRLLRKQLIANAERHLPLMARNGIWRQSEQVQQTSLQAANYSDSSVPPLITAATTTISSVRPELQLRASHCNNRGWPNH